MTYNKRMWLNPRSSSSSGSIAVFDGSVKYPRAETETDLSFVEVADCHGKVRLHRCHGDSKLAYFKKVTKMKKVLEDYLIHLQANLEE
jgi:hypothetical protein